MKSSLQMSEGSLQMKMDGSLDPMVGLNFHAVDFSCIRIQFFMLACP